jgi:hypothetical protein
MHATKRYQKGVCLHWFENNTSVYVFSSYKIFTNASPYAVKRKSMPKYTFVLNVNDKIVKLYLN